MSRENAERVRGGYEFVRRTRGPDFELLHPDVVTMRDGKVTEIREHGTKAEALEAVGLEE